MRLHQLAQLRARRVGQNRRQRRVVHRRDRRGGGVAQPIRDALGEQCVLLFTHGQSPSQGHLLIGYAGAANIKKMVKDSKAPVIGAVREAHRTGKGAPSLMAQPIREILAQPIDDVRKALRIPQPQLYLECHCIWREEGIDPYDLLASPQLADEQELLAA